MTKEQDDECFRCGTGLAIFCIYFYDENKDFYENFKSLNLQNRNILLREIIYWRMAIVYETAKDKIWDSVNNDEDVYDEILGPITDGFLEALWIGLKLKGSFADRDRFIFGKLNEYKNFNKIDANFFLKKLNLNRKLSPEDLMHLRFNIPMQYTECKSYAKECIEFLFASPEKKSLILAEMKLLNQNNTIYKNKSGCLNIFFVFIIIFTLCTFI